MKVFLSCFFIIIGTIIGAGFASGREIVTFFNIYKESGLYGIIIASFILGGTVGLVGITIEKYDIDEYKKLVKNNKILIFILKAFSFVCYCIMISGVGAFLKESFNINFYYGSAIASVFCYALFLNNFAGINLLNNILVPFIIFGISFLGIFNYEYINSYNFNNCIDVYTGYTKNWFCASVLYAGYNSLILIPIIINLKKYKLYKKTYIALGFVTAIVVGFLMFFIYKNNNSLYPYILSVEFPNILFASLISKKVERAYSGIMISAILTTALSSGFSLLSMLNKENYEKNAFIMCIIAFVCSKFGFSNMINICFPFFGILGVFQIIIILFKLKSGVRIDE